MALIWPPGTGADAKRIIAARAVRGAIDGFGSLLVPFYLGALGFGPAEIGLVLTAAMFGTASQTLVSGAVAARLPFRPMLLGASALVAATGFGWAALSLLPQPFWPALVLAFCGAMNMQASDAGPFLPAEQALLARAVADQHRTALFARFGLAGALAVAFGSTLVGASAWLAPALGAVRAMAALFLVYGAVALLPLILYAGLDPAARAAPTQQGAMQRIGFSGLGPSRGRVLLMTAIFALDAFSGGLGARAIVALWLNLRFGVGAAEAGSLFFWAGLLGALSYLAAAPLARRIGLVNTMVFTHLPASVTLILLPWLPSAPWAMAAILGRAAVAEMDVPARNSWVMAVVTPAERPAASAITALIRNLAAAPGPRIAGQMLAASPFGWPLMIAGILKVVYDGLLLGLFARVRPPEERRAP
ncbi:MAG: MFS transporter [Alphaproteobacteria bacterium]|nr:MFS transporter [Alphaproteobacteria bacterium]